MLLILFTVLTYCQRTSPTSLDLALVQQQDPARYSRFMNLENFVATTIANQGGVGQRLINANGIITIPVVVHVIHNGENLGVGKNLSAAQIQSQIDVVNEDFRRLNPNIINTPAGLLPIASDYGFEFKLACTDPNGFSTDGIIRKYSSKSNFKFLFGNGSANLQDEVTIGIKVRETGSLP